MPSFDPMKDGYHTLVWKPASSRHWGEFKWDFSTGMAGWGDNSVLGGGGTFKHDPAEKALVFCGSKHGGDANYRMFLHLYKGLSYQLRVEIWVSEPAVLVGFDYYNHDLWTPTAVKHVKEWHTVAGTIRVGDMFEAARSGEVIPAVRNCNPKVVTKMRSAQLFYKFG